MASPTPAAKSQPSLHSFTVPRHLQWNKDGHHGGADQRHHQRRRSIKSPSRRPTASSSSSPVRRSPPRESSCNSNPGPPPSHPNQSVDYQSKAPQKLETKSKGKEVESPLKILIKIPCNSRTEEEEDVPIPPPPMVENKAAEEGAARMDEEMKTWNLRPRKPIRRPMDLDEKGPVRINGSEKNKAHLNPEKKEKKQKTKKVSIWSCLSKEEIEQDIFSMVGSKPAKRPKKRPKNIQRQVDNLFPGSWLVLISEDSYRVSEKSMKD